ncbi:flagellar L-ring protein FlgH (plasmid) [Ralstonia solanacearum]|nr:flagellar L-ring protein FlgH [Ralstonia solanacearum]
MQGFVDGGEGRHGQDGPRGAAKLHGMADGRDHRPAGAADIVRPPTEPAQSPSPSFTLRRPTAPTTGMDKGPRLY